MTASATTFISCGLCFTICFPLKIRTAQNFWPRFCSNCRDATGQKRHYRPPARHGCHPGTRRRMKKRKGSVAATCDYGCLCFLPPHPVASSHPFSAFQRLINVRFSGAGDDIRHPLGHRGCRFVIIGLADKTGTGVDISPHVRIALIPQLTSAGYHGFGIQGFRHAGAPCKTVQCAEKIRHQRCGSRLTRIPGNVAPR